MNAWQFIKACTTDVSFLCFSYETYSQFVKLMLVKILSTIIMLHPSKPSLSNTFTLYPTTSMWTSYVIVVMWVWLVAWYVAIPDVLGLRPKDTHIRQIKSSHITNNYVTFSLLRLKETTRGYISHVCLIPGIQVIICYCPGQCTFRCNMENLCTLNKHNIIIQVGLP